MAQSNTETMDDLEMVEASQVSSQSTTSNIVYARDGLGLYRASVKGGGPVPKVLEGAYTKRALIEQAITDYVSKRDAPKREYRKSRGT